MREEDTDLLREEDTDRRALHPPARGPGRSSARRAVSCRNGLNYQRFLATVEAANPEGDIVVVTDNLSSHNAPVLPHLSCRTWLQEHLMISHAFIPVGAGRPDLSGGLVAPLPQDCPGRSVLRRPEEIRTATRLATAQLNAMPNPGSRDGPLRRPGHCGAVLSTPFEAAPSQPDQVPWRGAGRHGSAGTLVSGCVRRFGEDDG